MMYPRKRMDEKLEEGDFPGTSFNCSDNKWVIQELHYKMASVFFLANIPPVWPVVFIEDGHSSHISCKLVFLNLFNPFTVKNAKNM